MQMYISFKLFNVENVVTLLAAKLKCVLNYRPYIRGECNHLVGWHRLRLSVRACARLRFLFTICFVTTRVYPASVRLLGGRAQWSRLSSTFSLPCSPQEAMTEPIDHPECRVSSSPFEFQPPLHSSRVTCEMSRARVVPAFTSTCTLPRGHTEAVFHWWERHRHERYMWHWCSIEYPLLLSVMFTSACHVQRGSFSPQKKSIYVWLVLMRPRYAETFSRCR